jgi:alanine racemase
MRTWVEINLDALRHNLRAIRARLAPGVGIMAVVKADGYGHGAVDTAKAIEETGAARFAVADLREARELRENGIRKPIQILFPQMPEERELCAREGFIASISSLDEAQSLQHAAERLHRRVIIHLDVDTGMGRLGAPLAEAPGLLRKFRALDRLRVEGLFTHFSSADAEDRSSTLAQIERFNSLIRRLRRVGLCPPLVHASNSAATAFFPEAAFSLVRPGLALWGLPPKPGVREALDLRPVLSLFTRIALFKTIKKGGSVGYSRRFIAQRDTRVAVLPAGYADGYRRGLSCQTGEVIVRGRRAPVLGIISMDVMSVDVTDAPEARAGDRVTLIGREPAAAGSEEARRGESSVEIPCESLAERIGTIPYEITCLLGRRVQRVYTGRRAMDLNIDVLAGLRKAL